MFTVQGTGQSSGLHFCSQNSVKAVGQFSTAISTLFCMILRPIQIAHLAFLCCGTSLLLRANACAALSDAVFTEGEPRLALSGKQSHKDFPAAISPNRNQKRNEWSCQGCSSDQSFSGKKKKKRVIEVSQKVQCLTIRESPDCPNHTSSAKVVKSLWNKPVQYMPSAAQNTPKA